MSEWGEVALGEVAETVLGKTLPKGSGQDVDGSPYLRNANVQWGRVVMDDLNRMAFTDAERAKYGLLAGDLLVCEGGEVGRCVLLQADIPGVYFQNAIHRVRVSDQTRLVPAFLALWLEHHVRRGGLSGLTSQVTIAHLNQSKLRSLRVPVPPLPEQLRIIGVIAAFDSVIDALARESSVVGRLLASVQNDIPDGPETAIRDVVERIESGRSVQTTGEPARPGEPSVLKLSAIRPAEFIGSESKRIDDISGFSDTHRVSEGDLLITRSNTPDRVGFAALARGVQPDTFMPDLVWRLRLNDSCLPEYMEHALSSATIRARVTATATGTSASMRKINKRGLSAVSLPVPSLEDQRSYAGCCEALGTHHRSLLAEAERLRALRSTLLSDLLAQEIVAGEAVDQFIQNDDEAVA